MLNKHLSVLNKADKISTKRGKYIYSANNNHSHVWEFSKKIQRKR